MKVVGRTLRHTIAGWHARRHTDVVNGRSFLKPQDLAFSVIKVLVFVVSVVIIHSYQGYYASGGAEGVGRASGRAIRSSLIIIVVEDMILTLLMWGFDSGVQISG